MLTQEPWCYTPEQIGRLTDWQIENLYALPAQERADEFRKDMEPKPAAPPPANAADNADVDKYPPGSPEHRHMVVGAFMSGPFRVSRKKANEMYDHQLSQWRTREGK
jgi:hypothetical protein